MKPRFESDAPLGPVPRVKPGAKSKHPPRDAARAHLARLTGVDLVAVTGISASIAQTLPSEIGTDMRQSPTVTHCCSWLGLAPRNDISGAACCARAR
jgi:transposase